MSSANGLQYNAIWQAWLAKPAERNAKLLPTTQLMACSWRNTMASLAKPAS